MALPIPIAAIADRRLEATTTVEVIQEFVHVRALRRDRGDAAGLGRDYAELLAPLLSPAVEDLEAGLAMFARDDALGAFDAVLAACAARAGIEALVSADTAFAGLTGVSHVVPDRSGLFALLNR